MATQVAAALPDDALAGVFHALPLRNLAVVRCVCKAWRDVVDGRALLLPHLLPRSVRGVFVNYVDHNCPHHFARPCSSSTFPRVDGMLSFLPNDSRSDWWSVLDHCNGLLLCDIDWSSELCVCNPATRRWTVLPRRVDADGKHHHRYAGAYIAFDPAASTHYQVILIPDVPKAPSAEDRRRVEKERRARLWEKERDKPFCLDLFFSLLEDGEFGDDEEEADESYHDEEFQKLPLSVDEEELDREVDPCRLMEWPPTPWTLRVFSSRTGEWEERAFVREGMPAGTVEKMRLDPLEPTFYGPRWRYAVYHHGSLYVHCRGSFVTRLSLSNNNYQIIETPANFKYTKPYLGKLQEGVCFGIVHEQQLKIWILNESCGQIEWFLKYEAEIGHYAQYVSSISYDYSGRQPDGSWIVEENFSIQDTNGDTKSQSEESYEWDSDNDDTFTVNIESQMEASYDRRHLNIMGFHPYKEVVFLVEPFGVVAYHLNSTKVQHLGNSRPKSYYHNHTNGIYETFLYTPCMVGDLLHGYQIGQGESESESSDIGDLLHGYQIGQGESESESED